MSRSGTQETPGEQNTPEHNQGNETGCKTKDSTKRTQISKYNRKQLKKETSNTDTGLDQNKSIKENNSNRRQQQNSASIIFCK